MKKFTLAALLVSVVFVQAQAQEATSLAPDVAIKCVIFPYDTVRTRIPDQPLAELTVKKDSMASLETATASLGSIEGLPQVNFELNKDVAQFNPEGRISMAFMETNAERTSSTVLAGGSLNNLGPSTLMYRSAQSQNIYVAQCEKQ